MKHVGIATRMKFLEHESRPREYATTGIALVVICLVGMLAGRASAQPTIGNAASLLEFPKVIADGTHDTVIQITNTSNTQRHAHCFYVNGAPANPQLPPGPSNPPLWQVMDFNLHPTAQQPVQWVVSQGRAMVPNPTDPGSVPPVSSGFTGELLCVEVDSSGAPESGNSLVGEASLTDLGSGDVAKYSAVGFRGSDNNNSDNVLCLGGGVSQLCPTGGEYDACPDTWRLDFLTDGAEDPIIGSGSTVHTNLAVVPCAHDFETSTPQSVTLQFVVTSEFETVFSTSTTVTCWADFSLGSVFPPGFVGSTFAQTTIRSPSGTGFVMVAQEVHDSGGAQPLTASAAANLHVEGRLQGPDLVVIPTFQ